MSTSYFAYGSNLKMTRMLERVPCARPDGVARLDGYSLCCDKRSHDGSAKANLVEQPESCVWGVLYALREADLRRLDGFEAGYTRIAVQVTRVDGEGLGAVSYRSRRTTPDAVAFDWYVRLMVEGAREHRLPEEHVARLAALPARPDPRCGAKGRAEGRHEASQAGSALPDDS